MSVAQFRSIIKHDLTEIVITVRIAQGLTINVQIFLCEEGRTICGF